MTLILALLACSNSVVTLGDSGTEIVDDTNDPDTGDTNDTDTGDTNDTGEEPEPDHAARGTYKGVLGWYTEGWDICSMDASIRVNKVGGLKFDDVCPYTTQSGQLVELAVSIEGSVDEDSGEFVDAVITWQSWEVGWNGWEVSEFQAPLYGVVENNEILFAEFTERANFGSWEGDMIGYIEASQ
ncbi:MAG: hypothetical protein VX899_10450 [Myxococcota bacterium]|nr:hypothetical protein [Myxococcota bacterium]